MNRLQNYKRCFCGKELTKRNRFGVKIEAPEHVNTLKREKEKKPYKFKTCVLYMCEICSEKAEKAVSNTLKADFYIYNDHVNPV